MLVSIDRPESMPNTQNTSINSCILWTNTLKLGKVK